MFELYADKNKLSVLGGREPVTSGSVNVYQVRFRFSSDWEGLARTAVFRAGSEPVSVLLDDSGVCAIPWEVMTRPFHCLLAGVYGTKDGKVVLPTVWASLGTILEGVSAGEEARPPTPDLWRQELAGKQDKLTGLPGQVVGFDADGNAVARDAPEGGGGGGGSSAYQFGHGLKVDQATGTVAVDTVDGFNGDNTLPITASAVQAAVGNINILLQKI